MRWCPQDPGASSAVRSAISLFSQVTKARTVERACQQALRDSGRGAFANCTQARAAGAAPLYRGEPGYGRHLDRDNDGVACEPYRKR